MGEVSRTAVNARLGRSGTSGYSHMYGGSTSGELKPPSPLPPATVATLEKSHPE